MIKLLETYVIKEVIIDPLKMRKSKEKWILKYTILDDPNTMIIMGFNNGRISLYDISHLRFDGDILEVDNVFRREGISCLCDINDFGLYFMSPDTGTKKLFVLNF